MLSIFGAKAAQPKKGQSSEQEYNDEDLASDRNMDRNPDDGPNEPTYFQLMWQIPAVIAVAGGLFALMMMGMINQAKNQKPQPEPSTNSLEYHKQ